MTAEEQTGVDAVIEQDQDSVRISPRLLPYRRLAAGEVEGIAGMSGGLSAVLPKDWVVKIQLGYQDPPRRRNDPHRY